jgi:hypothetical protein
MMMGMSAYEATKGSIRHQQCKLVIRRRISEAHGSLAGALRALGGTPMQTISLVARMEKPAGLPAAPLQLYVIFSGLEFK